MGGAKVGGRGRDVGGCFVLPLSLSRGESGGEAQRGVKTEPTRVACARVCGAWVCAWGRLENLSYVQVAERLFHVFKFGDKQKNISPRMGVWGCLDLAPTSPPHTRIQIKYRYTPRPRTTKEKEKEMHVLYIGPSVPSC